MSNRKHLTEGREPKRWRRINTWIAIGAVALIVILIIWLTAALSVGDTDVAAYIAPTLRF